MDTGAGCQNPRSFGLAEEPPVPRSDSSYTQVLQAALGLCVSSGVLPLQRSNVIHPPVTTHTSLLPARASGTRRCQVLAVVPRVGAAPSLIAASRT